MSTLRDILSIDSSRKIAEIATSEIISNPNLIQELNILISEDTYPLSMRAARILPFIVKQNKSLIEKNIEWYVSVLPHLKVEGNKRGVIRALYYLLNKDYKHLFRHKKPRPLGVVRIVQRVCLLKNS